MRSILFLTLALFISLSAVSQTSRTDSSRQQHTIDSLTHRLEKQSRELSRSLDQATNTISNLESNINTYENRYGVIAAFVTLFAGIVGWRAYAEYGKLRKEAEEAKIQFKEAAVDYRNKTKNIQSEVESAVDSHYERYMKKQIKCKLQTLESGELKKAGYHDPQTLMNEVFFAPNDLLDVQDYAMIMSILQSDFYTDGQKYGLIQKLRGGSPEHFDKYIKNIVPSSHTNSSYILKYILRSNKKELFPFLERVLTNGFYGYNILI